MNFCGIEYGCQSLRVGYYWSYMSQDLAVAVKDPSTLDSYNKRLFLREKRKLMPRGLLSLIKEQSNTLIGPKIEDAIVEEEGCALKRIKAPKLGPSSPTLDA